VIKSKKMRHVVQGYAQGRREIHAMFLLGNGRSKDLALDRRKILMWINNEFVNTVL
jgi:GTP-binding protein EngB required for normal cell division